MPLDRPLQLAIFNLRFLRVEHSISQSENGTSDGVADFRFPFLLGTIHITLRSTPRLTNEPQRINWQYKELFHGKNQSEYESLAKLFPFS